MRQSRTILTLIGLFKLVKVVGLVAGGIAMLSLVHRDVAHGIKGWIDNFEPENRYMREAVAKLSDLNPHTLEFFGIAMLCYAVLFLIEGVGLLAHKLWAEYLTTIITTSFIPLEVYEAAEKGSWLKAAVIAANVAIVVYLVLRLRANHHWPFRHHVDAASTATKPAFA